MKSATEKGIRIAARDGRREMNRCWIVLARGVVPSALVRWYQNRRSLVRTPALVWVPGRKVHKRDYSPVRQHLRPLPISESHKYALLGPVVLFKFARVPRRARGPFPAVAQLPIAPTRGHVTCIYVWRRWFVR